MQPFDIDIGGGNLSPAVVFLLLAMTLVNFLMAAFWIVVGWRGLKAHERLPETLRRALSPRSDAP